MVWYGMRFQLFFNCTLCPTDAKGHSGLHKEVSLVYFSTFEPIKLTPGSVMQRAGVPMLYDSASNPRLPCLYVTNVLGQALLIPCFVGGNSHPTIPHSFKDDQRLGSASADTQRDRGNGSRLYEVNIWTWRYGRGRPRVVSIAKAERIRSERVSESRKSGVSVSARAGSEQLRRGSGAAKRPALGLPAAVQNEQRVYDIIYDINVYDINVGTVLIPYQ
jgi:hypothetical protein